MKRLFVSNNAILGVVISVLFACVSLGINAQGQNTVYTIKKGETIFAIAKKHGVTIQDIINANPEMNKAGYVLSVGAKINIPGAAVTKNVVVGVMLPLHDINGDGRRMVEYYRGMLLALNDLKQEGVSVEMNVWNVPEDGDVTSTLADVKASRCDVIFGPLYTTQVPEMARFCKDHDIRLVIPFSINGGDVRTCPNVYQVYQTPEDVNASTINDFVKLFANAHPVFVDCNDVTSKKSDFTKSLRSALENHGISYSITNVKNDNATFAKAFAVNKQNVVVLNTARSPELGQVIQQLDKVKALQPQMRITLFGYNEWFMYAKVYKDKFKKYNAYIPSVYDYNESSSAIQRIENKYLTYFGQPMMQAIPRFAITGYDQLMFFVKGICQYGAQFHGLPSQKCYTPVQTPYSFDKYQNGGYQNKSFMLVQYK